MTVVRCAEKRAKSAGVAPTNRSDSGTDMYAADPARIVIGRWRSGFAVLCYGRLSPLSGEWCPCRWWAPMIRLIGVTSTSEVGY